MIDEPTSTSETGPRACPFVAFEDDRDHRSTSPDYRHRCFAAAEPESRAFPQQEKYCLTAGFPQCPVFLDWARQEAAAVKVGTTPVSPAETAAAITGASLAAESVAPAFLASRTRTMPDDASAATRRAADASATLWTYDTQTKHAPAPAAPPPPSSLGAPAVAMARRGPSHPGWENPPRLENFPRLRSREERRANQPLLIAAIGMALVMVALILFPVLSSPKSGGIGGGGAAGAGGSSASEIASAGDESPTPEATPTPAPAKTLPDGYFSYRVLPGDFVAKIAQKFNLQVWELEVANSTEARTKMGLPSISNFDILYVGWTLLIPPPGLLTPPPTTLP